MTVWPVCKTEEARMNGFKGGGGQVRGSEVDNDIGRDRSHFMQNLEGEVGGWILFQEQLEELSFLLLAVLGLCCCM